MAINTRSIKGAPNAFEYSETIVVAIGGAEQVTDSLLATTNSTGMTFGIKRKGVNADEKYKVQLTYSTTAEVNSGTAEWHDWDIAGLDVDGFLGLDVFEQWIPIPAAMRIVTKSVLGGSVYWAVRGQ